MQPCGPESTSSVWRDRHLTSCSSQQKTANMHQSVVQGWRKWAVAIQVSVNRCTSSSPLWGNTGAHCHTCADSPQRWQSFAGWRSYHGQCTDPSPPAAENKHPRYISRCSSVFACWLLVAVDAVEYLTCDILDSESFLQGEFVWLIIYQSVLLSYK